MLTNVDGNETIFNSNQTHPRLFCQLPNFVCPLIDLATQVEHIGYVYIQSVICCIGLILNIINFNVFIRRCFQTSTFVYMSALSVADAFTLIIKLPGCFVKVKGAEYRELRFALTYYLHYFETPMSSVCETVSVWLTLTLAVERFVAMRYYGFSRTACTRINARLIVCALVVVSIALNMPQFFLFTNKRYRDYDGHTCIRTHPTAFYSSSGYEAYSWLRNVLVQFAPLIGLLVANICLLTLVRRHALRMSAMKGINAAASTQQCGVGGTGSASHDNANNRSSSTRRIRAQQKLTSLLIVIIFLFLIGQIPQALAFHKVFNALFGKWVCHCTYNNMISTCSEYRIYRIVAQCLGMSSYSATFFVYLTLNRHFRDFLCAASCSLCGNPSHLSSHFNVPFSEGPTHQQPNNHRTTYTAVPKAAGSNCHVKVSRLEKLPQQRNVTAQAEMVEVFHHDGANNDNRAPLILLSTEL